MNDASADAPKTRTLTFQDTIDAGMEPITALHEMLEDMGGHVDPKHVAILLVAAKRDAGAFILKNHDRQRKVATAQPTSGGLPSGAAQDAGDLVQ